MPAPAKKEEKVPVLKGKEAEDRVLQYMKECNRPYGAADVSANIKNVVSKANTQKVLATLAERGAITQKVYGKTCYYVANQSECGEMSTIELDALETRNNILNDEVKELTAQQKQLSTELSQIRSTPSDADLGTSLESLEREINELEATLAPMRSGSALISDEEVKALDSDWVRWKNDWTAKKKIFATAWGLIADAVPSTEWEDLQDELGIELDTDEHVQLEQSELCQTNSRRR